MASYRARRWSGAPPTGSRRRATPTEDSASGSGPFINFAITSGPSGENPTGFFSAEAFGTHFEMTSVTCLAVNGNTATFVGPILPNAIFSQGGNIKLTVVDNGPAGTDTLASSGQVPPFDCLSPLPQPGSVVLADIVVVDAPPLPTTKAQCMGDGWQAYGVFKNEGDCVSFVATGGKNPPGVGAIGPRAVGAIGRSERSLE